MTNQEIYEEFTAYKQIRDTIKSWVGKNYGTQEMEDPSWDINGLALELFKRRFDIYDSVKYDGLLEDINCIAESYDTELTEEEKGWAIHQYYKMDDETTEQLSIIIDNIINERSK